MLYIGLISNSYSNTNTNTNTILPSMLRAYMIDALTLYNKDEITHLGSFDFHMFW